MVRIALSFRSRVLIIVALCLSFFMLCTISTAAETPEVDCPTITFQDQDKGYTGVAKATDGKWYRVVNGEADLSATGIYQNDLGWWRVVDGVVDFHANGIYKNEYGWWKCTGGKVTFQENGIFRNEFGWWYCKDSKVDFQYTGVAKNQYGWWRVENGKVNFNANGIYQNDFGWWKTSDGKVTFQETGVFENNNGWFYCKNSKVDFGFNGVAENEFGKWYCSNGKVDFRYNGFGRNDEGSWLIENGKVQENRNGPLDIGTRSYTVTNGNVTYDGITFLQVDSPWSDLVYGPEALSTSGCGPLALVNAISNLNDQILPIKTVADWGYKNKYFNSDSFGGISNKNFFTKAANRFGSSYQFKYSGYGKSVTASSFLKHLMRGGTAVLHVKGHYIAAIDYDAASKMYFIIDSYPGFGTSMPSVKRTTSVGGNWVKLDELTDGWLTVSEYWMYTNT